MVFPTLPHLLAAVVAMAPAASATEAEDAGRDIAERLCARCHAVGDTGASTLPIAPPFRTFARKWPLENLEEALAEGIVTGHPMPEFTFEPDEINDLLAYIATLTPSPD